jgi:hypothetical protein
MHFNLPFCNSDGERHARERDRFEPDLYGAVALLPRGPCRLNARLTPHLAAY